MGKVKGEKNAHGFSQAYGSDFASVYNSYWSFFSQRVAPELLRLFEGNRRLKESPRDLLDLCCGTGQLANAFLDHGYRVVGIDLSPDMLQYARDNNREAVEKGRAVFVEGDASAFTLKQPVSFAVSLFDALNHLPDLEALCSCFQSVWSALRTPGLFVFDLNTALGFERWNGITIQDEEEITMIKRGIYVRGADRAYTSITGFVRNLQGTYERFTARVFESVFAVARVLGSLERVGFTGCYVARAGDLASPVKEPEELGRVFFVCRKG